MLPQESKMCLGRPESGTSEDMPWSSSKELVNSAEELNFF
jgi:hypothetical protein